MRVPVRVRRLLVSAVVLAICLHIFFIAGGPHILKSLSGSSANVQPPPRLSNREEQLPPAPDADLSRRQVNNGQPVDLPRKVPDLAVHPPPPSPPPEQNDDDEDHVEKVESDDEPEQDRPLFPQLPGADPPKPDQKLPVPDQVRQDSNDRQEETKKPLDDPSQMDEVDDDDPEAQAKPDPGVEERQPGEDEEGDDEPVPGDGEDSQPEDANQRSGKNDQKQDQQDDGDGAAVAVEDEVVEVSRQMVEGVDLLNERKHRILVMVITGGKKPTVQSNRQAVLETWFAQSEDAYFVTLEDVGTDRVIRLSEYAESGGHKGLPRKVKHMFHYAYEHFLDQYDWFVKADDDTFIHWTRLHKVLSVFNPDIPVYLGKPFSSRIRGATGPGPLWQDFMTMNFCHGGSAYALSRELLRRTGAHIHETPDPTALEDCAMAAALYEATGVRCININSNMFGGFDLLGNSHDQDFIMRSVKSYEKRSPITLYKTTTIHSVQAATTRYLYTMYEKLDQDPLLERQADKLAARDMESRRILLTTSWNCTLPTPYDDQVSYEAICQQPAVLSSAGTPGPTWKTFQSTWSVSQDIADFCDALPRALEEELSSASSKAYAAFAGLAKPRDPIAANSFRIVSSRVHRNVVFVGVDPQSMDAIKALDLFIRSLRAVGCGADVLVLTTNPAKKGLADVVDAHCGVGVVRFDQLALSQKIRDEVHFKPTDTMLYYAMVAAYLNTNPGQYDNVLYASVFSFFQRDPFRSMNVNEGVLVFVKDPIVTVETIACFHGQPRIHEQPSHVSTDVVMGTETASRLFFAAAININFRSRRCSFDDTVMLALYRKEFVMYSPVTIITPWDGPVVQLRSDGSSTFINETATTGDKSTGRILFTNVAGTVASIVTSYRFAVELTESESGNVVPVYDPDQSQSPLKAMLAAQPKKLHYAVIKTSSFPRLTAEQWPSNSKAYLKWSALSAAYSMGQAKDVFRPLWELLAQYAQFRRDPAKPSVTRVAAPMTHKTGGHIVTGILYRYAARNALRMYQPTDYPFILTEILKAGVSKANKHGYDMCINQLSAKGQLRLTFDTVNQFYNNLLRPEYRMVSLLREPRQHYVSWMYHYIVPRKRKYTPDQIMEEFLTRGFNRNLQMQTFGAKYAPAIKRFMDSYVDKFDLIMIAERLDESLVLMRRLFNWDLFDITYTSMRRPPNEPPLVKRAPRIENMDKDLVSKISELTKEDQQVYQQLRKRFDDLVAQQGDDFQEEVAAFQKVQAALADACKRQRQHPLCMWYRLSDVEFYKMIGPAGYTTAVPML